MSDSTDKTLQLVGMIYDAALDESKWSPFLERFASTVGGSSAILRSNDIQAESATFNASVGYDPAWRITYCEHYAKVDYYDHVMKQHAPGKVFISDQHIDQHKLRKTEYFNDFLLPQDKLHAMGVILLKDDKQSLVLGIQRSKHAGAFGEKEAQLMSAIAPHVKRAVQIHRKIHTVTAEKAQAHTVLDQMRMGVILTNRSGIPLYLNRAAELMMTQDVGLGIFHKRLATHSPAETAQLHKLIWDTSLGMGGDMRISMPDKTDFLHCVVTPVSSELAFMLDSANSSDCVAIFLSRPGGLQLSPKRLVTLYKITPAEARLAARLAALRTLEEASDDLGISISTTRTQLKSIFSKTGTNSQSELLMLLATGTLAHINTE